MECERLEIGDAVRLVRAYLGVPAGTRGDIIQMYRSIEELYRVRFDRRTHPMPVFRNYLEVVERADEHGPDARRPTPLE